ncbi:MAG: hypothetical protein AXW12_00605 [Thalassospira sp. Nap_22]|nr:MAG: hypothetical protein AXW12_00605 [Thalassospira sp. Nap_22]
MTSKPLHGKSGRDPMAPLLTPEQLTAFADLARKMMDEKRPTSSIKVALGKTFGLNQIQVKNMLWRQQIKLGNRLKGCRVLADLSDTERAEILELAAAKLSEGVVGDEIRAMLCEKFDVAERTVSAFCVRNNIDVRSEHSKKNAKDYGGEGLKSIGKIDLDEADYDPSQDVFIKAAKKLRDSKHDVRFDADREQWWLDHRPVSRIELAEAAGMGC